MCFIIFEVIFYASYSWILLGIIEFIVFMAKKVKNLYLRKGEHSFILQSSFICRARKHNWSKAEIDMVIKKTLYKDRISVYKILIEYVDNK